MVLDGCDLSAHQYTVDFDLLKPKVGFVAMKATEGIGFVDGQFTRNWSEARRVGLPRIAYHFARPDLNGPADEANYFCNIVGGLKSGDMLSLDYESHWPGDVVGWCKSFLDTVKDRTTLSPLLYLNMSLVRGYDWSSVSPLYGLWLAFYDFTTAAIQTPWPVLAFKQYSDAGILPGVPTNVDLDVFYGTAAQLQKYGMVGSMADDVVTKVEFEAYKVGLQKEIEDSILGPFNARISALETKLAAVKGAL